MLEVGGDWYDAFELPDGRIALTVGDVVGHGLAAAAAMGQVRTALAALADHAAGPGELLERLDGFLARSRTTDFATVCYVVIDPATGALEYASAGHPPMLVVSAAGDTIWLDQAQSGPLCGGEPRDRPQASTVLEPGSLLVLYSDGLVERRKERFEDGLERLAAAGRAVVGLPVEEVCRTLVARLGVDSSRDDDVAVMAVRLEDGAGVAVPPSVPGVRRRVARAPRIHEMLARWTSGRDNLCSTRSSSRSARRARIRSSTPTATGEPGDVVVDMTQSAGDGFLVEIRDSGSFRPAVERDDRGRGTEIMRRLTADFSRESTSTGTVVRFRVSSGKAFAHD